MRILLLLLLNTLALAASAQSRNKLLDSLEATLPQQPDSMRPHVLKALALGYRRIDSEKARQWAERDARESQRLHRAVDYAHALSVLGMLAKDQGKFQEAIRYQLDALKIHEREHSYIGILNANNDIGVLYKALRLKDKALVFFQQEVALCRQLLARPGLSAKEEENYRVSWAYALNNVGNCYLDKGDFAKSKPYFEQAAARGQQLGINDIGAVAYANLASAETGLGHLPAALGYFQQSLALDQADENEFGQAETLTSMAELYKKTHDDRQAERTLLRALALANRLHTLPTLQQVHRELGQLYQRTGRYQQATRHFAQLVGIADTLYNQDVTQKVAELQTKYETEKKEAQNRLLQQQQLLQGSQLRVQEQVIRRRTVQLGSGLAIAGLLAGLGYLLYNRRRLRREVEFGQERQQLSQQRAAAVLEAEETERRRIGADLHDGVGQLLTVARLNLEAL
ncbi:MAG: tetratricopeptide repeat protein, partial [Bacteroidota bacterium]|nr:tetratricopeptide repeat protein [Bacteroidota bacterium]